MITCRDQFSHRAARVSQGRDWHGDQDTARRAEGVQSRQFARQFAFRRTQVRSGSGNFALRVSTRRAPGRVMPGAEQRTVRADSSSNSRVLAWSHPAAGARWCYREVSVRRLAFSATIRAACGWSRWRSSVGLVKQTSPPSPCSHRHRSSSFSHACAPAVRTGWRYGGAVGHTGRWHGAVVHSRYGRHQIFTRGSRWPPTGGMMALWPSLFQVREIHRRRTPFAELQLCIAGNASRGIGSVDTGMRSPTSAGPFMPAGGDVNPAG